MIRAPGPWSCGSTLAIRHSNPCRWSTDRGPSKTNQRQLCTGNAGNRSTVRTLLSDRALVLGSRSTGLGGMVEEPRARFHVAKWRAFCHTKGLRNSPPRLKLVWSDSTHRGLLDLPLCWAFSFCVSLLSINFCYVEFVSSWDTQTKCI